MAHEYFTLMFFVDTDKEISLNTKSIAFYGIIYRTNYQFLHFIDSFYN